MYSSNRLKSGLALLAFTSLIFLGAENGHAQSPQSKGRYVKDGFQCRPLAGDGSKSIQTWGFSDGGLLFTEGRDISQPSSDLTPTIIQRGSSELGYIFSQAQGLSYMGQTLLKPSIAKDISRVDVYEAVLSDLVIAQDLDGKNQAFHCKQDMCSPIKFFGWARDPIFSPNLDYALMSDGGEIGGVVVIDMSDGSVIAKAEAFTKQLSQGGCTVGEDVQLQLSTVSWGENFLSGVLTARPFGNSCRAEYNSDALSLRAGFLRYKGCRRASIFTHPTISHRPEYIIADGNIAAHNNIEEHISHKVQEAWLSFALTTLEEYTQSIVVAKSRGFHSKIKSPQRVIEAFERFAKDPSFRDGVTKRFLEPARFEETLKASTKGIAYEIAKDALLTNIQDEYGEAAAKYAESLLFDGYELTQAAQGGVIPVSVKTTEIWIGNLVSTSNLIDDMAMAEQKGLSVSEEIERVMEEQTEILRFIKSSDDEKMKQYAYTRSQINHEYLNTLIDVRANFGYVTFEKISASKLISSSNTKLRGLIAGLKTMPEKITDLFK